MIARDKLIEALIRSLQTPRTLYGWGSRECYGATLHEATEVSRITVSIHIEGINGALRFTLAHFVENSTQVTDD